MVALKEARQLGLKAGPALVNQQIKEMPFLQGPSGQFDFNAYQNFVAQISQTMRISQSEFEEMFRDDLTVALLEKLVFQGVHVTEAEIEQLHQDLYKAYDLLIFQVTTPPEDANLEPTPEEVSEYFEANQADFRVPDQRSVSYVAIEYAAYTNSVSVAQADLEGYFDRNIEEYVDEEGNELTFEEAKQQVETDLRQVLARKEAYEASEAFYDMISPAPTGPKPVSFEEAAAEFNLEIKTTPLFRRSGMIPGLGSLPEFRSTAFMLSEDYPKSDPVAEDNAVYIMKLAEEKDSYLPDLEEADQDGRVTSAVRSKLRNEAIENRATAVRDILASTEPKDAESLKTKAEEESITVREFTDITQMDAFQQLRQFPQAAMEMATLEEGAFSEAVRGFPGFYFITVTEIKPADPEKLAERRDQLEGMLKQQYQAARNAEWNAYLMKKFDVVRLDDRTIIPSDTEPAAEDLETESETDTETES
jgi:peptidyl-prolyl cis-trans isomerase D